MMSDYMIILKAIARGAELRKAYARGEDGAWKAAPYTNAKTFVAAGVAVRGLGDLRKHLVALADKPSCCVIRGAPRPGLDLAARHVRQYLEPSPTPDNPTPPAATYDAADHRWICVDVDKGRFPDALRGGADLGRCASWVVSKLPEWIQRAGWLVQWSNSAGLDEWTAAKAHVWIWLDRPVCDESLRAYWEVWNRSGRAGWGLEVDPAVFSPVQLHYTAAPRFDGEPMADPCVRLLHGHDFHGAARAVEVDQRIIYCVGDAASPPAELAALEEHARRVGEADRAAREARKLAAGRREATSSVWGAAQKLTRYGAAAMARATGDVGAMAGDPSFYLKLRSEIFSTFGLVAEGALTEDAWRGAWEECRDQYGLDLSSKNLNRLVEGAIKKSRPRDLGHVGGALDAAAQLHIGGAGASSSAAAGFARHND